MTTSSPVKGGDVGKVRHSQDAQCHLRRIRELAIAADSTDSAAVAIPAALTHRDLEILTHLASGDSNHEIARELPISTNTVANPHRQHPLAKLHIENRIQAAVQAARSGIS